MQSVERSFWSASHLYPEQDSDFPSGCVLIRLHMEDSVKIRGRYFIVGSARSGTTLLQAMLASHSRVFSLPETHFFCRAVPRRRRYRLLGLASRKGSKRALEELIALLARPDLAQLGPARYSITLKAHGRAFQRILDRATADAGKDVWVEKTPHHIDFIPEIQRTVRAPRFIHILRDGRDVVASQQHASLQDPTYWKTWTVEQLVKLWNKDVRTSLRYERDPRHLLVSYEALITDPQQELHRICDFVGIQFEESMLQHWQAAEQVLGPKRSHPWMQTAYKPVQDTRLKKFRSVFTVEQQRYITSNLLFEGQVGRRLGDKGNVLFGHTSDTADPAPRSTGIRRFLTRKEVKP